MSDFTARLEALLRHCSASRDQSQGDSIQLGMRFHKDLELLVAEYGRETVDAALLWLSDETWPSVSLH
jgi:hypothetical protein